MPVHCLSSVFLQRSYHTLRFSLALSPRRSCCRCVISEFDMQVYVQSFDIHDTELHRCKNDKMFSTRKVSCALTYPEVQPRPLEGESNWGLEHRPLPTRAGQVAGICTQCYDHIERAGGLLCAQHKRTSLLFLTWADCLRVGNIIWQWLKLNLSVKSIMVKQKRHDVLMNKPNFQLTLP